MWNRQTIVKTIGALSLVLACSSVTLADPPGFLKFLQRKKELPTDGASLVLKAEHGPILILATTMSGNDGMNQAIELAKEIRTELKLPAFVMERQGGGVTVLGRRTMIDRDQYGNDDEKTFRVRYANSESFSDYAVLVGEFASMEDPAISEVLNEIRYAQPSSLQVSDPEGGASDSSVNDKVQQTRKWLWSFGKAEARRSKGPMGAAFVTRNPLLPDDYFQPPKVDDFVASLNKEVEHSLLNDCKGRFTVRVASFTGKEVTDFGNGSRASSLGELSNALDRGALKAHKMTEALRSKGVEAYEFHDKFGSYVSIGSFDSLGKTTEDGQFSYDPRITRIMKQYCGYEMVDSVDKITGARMQTMAVKEIDLIPFDLEGKPMAVPRAETSRLYSGSLLGGGR